MIKCVVHLTIQSVDKPVYFLKYIKICRLTFFQWLRRIKGELFGVSFCHESGFDEPDSIQRNMLKKIRIKQTFIGKFQMGNHRQCQKRELVERFFQRAACLEGSCHDFLKTGIEFLV